MTTRSQYSRIMRRETHSSRSGAAITVAVLMLLVLAWLGTESVLALAGRPALLLSPSDLATLILELPDAVLPVALVTAGVLVVAAGILLILIAVLPGRRARHTSREGRTAVVIDNAAIASALAGTASRAANINPDQVTATVGHRTAEVRVQPTSGFHVDGDAVTQAVRAQLESLELAPPVTVSVTIARQGVVRS